MCCREIEIRYIGGQHDQLHMYAGIYSYYNHYKGHPVYRKLTGLDSGLEWNIANRRWQVFMFIAHLKGYCNCNFVHTVRFK